MTAIDPLSSSLSPALQSAMSAPTTSVQGTDSDQINQQMFLKLLVAQLENQDPSSPMDSNQFIEQTAQLTMVQRLNDIASASQAQTASNQVLEAASMVGKNVSIQSNDGTPTTTTTARIGGNLSADAPVGTKVSTTANVYSTKGATVPLRIEYTKLPDGNDGTHHWQASVYVSTAQIAGPFTVDFDNSGKLTSSPIQLTTTQLDAVPGSTGDWNPTGIKLDEGTASDPNGLHTSSGGSTLTLLDQDGSDGQSVQGIVTSVKFLSTGPTLNVGGKDYPLTDVIGVST
jgi:flagellar basal-body rod modification protein FlgD